MTSRSRRLTHAFAPATRAMLSLVCVGAQLLGTAHLLTTHHEICAEHGEAIHEASPHGRTLDAGDRTPLRHAALSSSDGAGSVERHEHCLVVSDRRDRAELRAASGALPLPSLPAVRVRRPCAPDAPHAIALLALAPKSSPPV